MPQNSKRKASSKKKSFVRIVEVIAKDPKGRVLILKRNRNNSHYVGKWQLPGGKAWQGESAIRAIKREVLEETNCKCVALERLKQIVFSEHFDGNEFTVELDIFECKISGEICLSKDHSEYRFVSSSRIVKRILAPVSRKALFD